MQGLELVKVTANHLDLNDLQIHTLIYFLRLDVAIVERSQLIIHFLQLFKVFFFHRLSDLVLVVLDLIINSALHRTRATSDVLGLHCLIVALLSVLVDEAFAQKWL